MLYSIVTGLAVTTLVATGLLFVAQALEDFRDA
jgi:hypothetical protein